MAFRWGSRKKGAEPTPETAKAPEAQEADDGPDVFQCLDALASSLRAWGELALELPDEELAAVQGHFEEWARHLVTGSPPPGMEEGEGSGARDLEGATRFVREHRIREVEHARRTQGDLRDIVWVFVQSLNRVIASDRQADDRTHQQLSKLRQAAAESDFSALKREAVSSADLIESMIEARKARYQEQIQSLAGRVDKMSEELASAQRRGETDALTKVYNRAALDEYLARLTELGLVVGSQVVAFIVDIDHFKWVNDRFGHLVGDEILKRVAAALRREFRRGSDFIARYGGDEFVVLAHDDSMEKARSLGERVLHAIRNVEFPHEGEKIRVSASVGAARLERGEGPKAWLERADRALYQAKEAGRDRLVVYVEESQG